MPLIGEQANRQPEETTSAREARAAVAIAAALYIVGASLIATTCAAARTWARPPARPRSRSRPCSRRAASLIAFSRHRGGIGLACIADLWGVVLITVLCASTGGASSPFGLIYFFALGHAAAFQPRGRLIVVSVAALVGFLAPLAYSEALDDVRRRRVRGRRAGAAHRSGHPHRARTHARAASRPGVSDRRHRQPRQLARPGGNDSKIARTAVPEYAELCVIDLLDGRGSMASTIAAAVDPAVAAEMERLRAARPAADGQQPSGGPGAGQRCAARAARPDRRCRGAVDRSER